jgi:hypothetical protein
MAALSIAFDIIIVGALALPWVLLAIDLFFSTNVSRVRSLLHWVVQQKQPAVAGVLLFAMTYALGSVVSRIAQDFFDDDDLHIHAFHRLFRVGVTESSIRTNVFCNAFKNTETPNPSEPSTKNGEQPGKTNTVRNDPTTEKHKTFQENNPKCEYTGRWIIRTRHPQTDDPIIVDKTNPQRITAEWINQQEDLAARIFLYHEAAVLQLGTDANERLRQYHDQIMVLRGAAFNGIIIFTLCLFWWSAQSFPGLGWAVSFLYGILGVIAVSHHFAVTPISNPPYMEFTLFTLMAAGWYVLRTHALKERRGHEKRAPRSGQKKFPFGYLVLAAFVTVASSLGWWATQVLYDQQIIYSYQALSEAPVKPVTPKGQ